MVDTFILEDSNFIINPESYSSYYKYCNRRRAWYNIIVGSTTLMIDSCTFTTNAASFRGGALYIPAVTISLCTFNNNTAARGGAQGGVVYIDAINSIIKGSTFFDNTVRGGGAEGGALRVYQSSKFNQYI